MKRTEREISDHIGRADKFQNERLTEGLKNNTYYKRELENLRNTLNETKSKVKSNHYPADTDDFLIKSTKEKVRQLQSQRERELSETFDEEDSLEEKRHKKSEKDSHSNFEQIESSRKDTVRERQSRREDEIYHRLYTKDQQNPESSRQKESPESSQMYELSQSLKSSSADHRNKLSGGLQNLSDRMNQMENELDNHLISQSNRYFTNKELVQEKQKQRERELQRKMNKDEEQEDYEEEPLENEEDQYEEDEDENERMQSIQEKTKSGRTITSARENRDNFKDAFHKREEKLRKDSQDLEKEINKKTVNFADAEAYREYDEEEDDGEEHHQGSGTHKTDTFEAELERLK